MRYSLWSVDALSHRYLSVSSRTGSTFYHIQNQLPQGTITLFYHTPPPLSHDDARFAPSRPCENLDGPLALFETVPQCTPGCVLWIWRLFTKQQKHHFSFPHSIRQPHCGDARSSLCWLRTPLLHYRRLALNPFLSPSSIQVHRSSTSSTSPHRWMLQQLPTSLQPPTRYRLCFRFPSHPSSPHHPFLYPSVPTM